MKKLVFDIETRNTFAEAGSRDPLALDLSLLVVYDYDSDQFTSYVQEDLPKLWPLLEQADMIIGFNSDYFDIPILNKYYPGDLSRIRSLDLLSEVKKSLGKRISLDMIAAGTLGREKTAHGLQAVEWWKEGKIEEIRKYCIEDVRITRDIYDYARANGRLKYKVVDEVREFAIDASAWEQSGSSAINFTLPF
ncbi:MAG: ribonuclease H-like domain-containing protein [Candidatus Falkowbacteria bacterium]